MSPFEMNYGRVPRVVGEVSYEDVGENFKPTEGEREYVRKLRNIISSAHERARRAVTSYWASMKRRFDKSRAEMKLQPGSKVLIALTDRERAKFPVRKLAPRWSDVATVVRELSNGVTYELTRADGKKATVQISRLLPLDGTLWGKLFPSTAVPARATARRVVEEQKLSPEEEEQEEDWHFEWEEPTPIRNTSTGIRPVPLSELRAAGGAGLEPPSPMFYTVKGQVPPHERLVEPEERGPLGPAAPPVADFVKASMSAEPKFEVERLTGKRRFRRRIKYRVKWAGYADDESTWEPRSTLLEDCPDLVREYDAAVEARQATRNRKPARPRQRVFVRSVACSDVRVLSRL